MVRLLTAVFLAAVTAGGVRAADAPPVMVFDTGGHTSDVVGAFFLPGDRQVVTASSDNTVRVWDVATAKTERMYRLPIDGKYDGTIQAAAISADRRFLAVGGNNPFDDDPYQSLIVHVIDLQDGKLTQTLVREGPRLRQLSFSPDGRYLAGSSCTRGAWFWNLETRQVHRLTEDRCCNAVRFHPTKSVVLVDGFRSPDGAITPFELFDVPSGRTVGRAADRRRADGWFALDLAWLGDGVVGGEGDMCLSYWNALGSNTFNRRLAVTVPAGSKDTEVKRVFISPDQTKLVAVGTADVTPNVLLVDAASSRQLVGFTEHQFQVQAADFSSDGRLVVTAGYKSEVYVWRADTGAVIARLRGPGGGFAAGGWSRRGTTLGFGRNMYEARDRAAARPIERGFDLATLTLSEAAGDGFVRATTDDPGPRARLGLVRAISQSRSTTPLQHGPPRPDGRPGNAPQPSRVTGMTADEYFYAYKPQFALLSDDRAVVGSHTEMVLCELSTGRVLRTFCGLAGGLTEVVPSRDGRYVLTSSYDQTLRVWSPDRDRPVLSVFVADTEWVAWTPEGYYACSPGGERLAGWQPPGTLGAFGRFDAAAQFNKHYYRTDVIKRVLAEGTAARAAEKIAGETRTPESPDFRRAQPPAVSIITPKALTKFADETIEVDVLAVPLGDNPITELRLQVNGRLYEGAGRWGTRTYVEPRRQEVREKFVVKVEPGQKYTLKALATAGKSEGESPAVRVETEGLEARKPRLLAVGIGIGTYADRADSAALPHGGRDATALLKTLEAHGKNLFRQVEAKSLTDGQATRENILDALRWMGKEMTDRDVGVFFFSGHADKDEQDLLYLCCHDTRRDKLITAGIPASQVKEHLAKTKGTIILVLDACYAGAIDGAVTKDGDSVNDQMARQFATSASGLIVLCSCRSNEKSHQDATDGGYFTHALIQGLKGQAKKVDGVVCLPQLYTFAEEVVRARSKNRQTPYYRANTGTLPAVALSRP